MYLRRVRNNGYFSYVLRESVKSEGTWRHRDILDLGPDPESHIKYPGGNGYYFSDTLIEKLEESGTAYSSEELELAFLPFFREDIRQVVEYFRDFRPSCRPAPPSGLSETLRDEQSFLRSFDRRRLHYLKFGRIDIGELEGRPWKFLNVLACKSRDEIEGLIERMEFALRDRELYDYLYTALNLQTYYPDHPLRNYPSGLERQAVDACFLGEICSLNRDEHFFAGVDDHDPGRLHPYLRRYVVLYFDYAENPTHQAFDHMRNFGRERVRFAPPAQSSGPTFEQALEVFALTLEQFRALSRKELSRRYRKKAMKRHPDQGGDHDAFVHLKAAYEILLRNR